MQIKNWFLDKKTRWKVIKIISVIFTIAFVVFNGVLGIVNHSIWNGSVCVYYIFLLSILLTIILNERKLIPEQEIEKQTSRKKVYYITTILLLIMNVSMFAPITYMVLHQNEVNIGLIPAIMFAAYTTYKVTLAIINYKRNRKSKNLSFRQIRTIKLIDAIMSILTLQYVLIAANSASFNNDMLTLSAVTSFIGIAAIFAISIISLIRFKKENANTLDSMEK